VVGRRKKDPGDFQEQLERDAQVERNRETRWRKSDRTRVEQRQAKVEAVGLASWGRAPAAQSKDEEERAGKARRKAEESVKDAVKDAVAGVTKELERATEKIAESATEQVKTQSKKIDKRAESQLKSVTDSSERRSKGIASRTWAEIERAQRRAEGKLKNATPTEAAKVQKNLKRQTKRITDRGKRAVTAEGKALADRQAAIHEKAQADAAVAAKRAERIARHQQAAADRRARVQATKAANEAKKKGKK
jgi:hypothetical protein